MRRTFWSIITLVGLLDAAQAQTQTVPCGVGYLSVTHESVLCQGAPLTITVTNTWTFPIFVLPCTLHDVVQGSCLGPSVGLQICDGPLTRLAPGASMDITWSHDTAGQLTAGSAYFMHLNYAATKLNFQSCCIPFSVRQGVTYYGSAKPGSGGHQPELVNAVAGPRIGTATFQLVIRNGLGGAPALLLFGTSPASSTGPFGTLFIDLARPHIMQPMLLGGPPNTPGAGVANLVVPIPNNPALIGFTSYTQAFIAESGASAGWSHTNGLSVTVCP